MFQLTDEAIESGIDVISGYIVSIVAERTGQSPEEISEKFYLSKTFTLLSDKKTGYYWDSISELIDNFRLFGSLCG